MRRSVRRVRREQTEHRFVHLHGGQIAPSTLLARTRARAHTTEAHALCQPPNETLGMKARRGAVAVARAGCHWCAARTTSRWSDDDRRVRFRLSISSRDDTVGGGRDDSLPVPPPPPLKCWLEVMLRALEGPDAACACTCATSARFSRLRGFCVALPARVLLVSTRSFCADCSEYLCVPKDGKSQRAGGGGHAMANRIDSLVRLAVVEEHRVRLAARVIHIDRHHLAPAMGGVADVHAHEWLILCRLGLD